MSVAPRLFRTLDPFGEADRTLCSSIHAASHSYRHCAPLELPVETDGEGRDRRRRALVPSDHNGQPAGARSDKAKNSVVANWLVTMANRVDKIANEDVTAAYADFLCRFDLMFRPPSGVGSVRWLLQLSDSQLVLFQAVLNELREDIKHSSSANNQRVVIFVFAALPGTAPLLPSTNLDDPNSCRGHPTPCTSAWYGVHSTKTADADLNRPILILQRVSWDKHLIHPNAIDRAPLPFPYEFHKLYLERIELATIVNNTSPATWPLIVDLHNLHI